VNQKFVLVTGGAGYIGSHTCKSLALEGFVPVAYDNLSVGRSSSVRWGPFVHGDLLDEQNLKATFAKYDFVGVIHFAAKAYVAESVKNPISYFEGNITATKSLVKIMQSFSVPIIVFSSSCATYGHSKSENISESDIQLPINPYGFTKLACEKLIEYVGQAHAFKYANLRYFNAAGADPDGELGEAHTPETHLIPLAIQAAITKSRFKIYGSDYPTNDGTAVRDFIHVSDLALAHVKAIKILLSGGNSFTSNLGTGNGYSVLEIVKEIKLRFPDFEYSLENRREGDPARLVANIELSKSFFKSRLQYSTLTSILNTAIAWQLSKEIVY
jgi:UDP-glucose-4-epimerase GalE